MGKGYVKIGATHQRMWPLQPILDRMHDCPVCGERFGPPDNYFETNPSRKSTNAAWTSGDPAHLYGYPCKLITHAAERLGYDARQLYRWQAEGVPDESAELIAFAMGVLPHQVWGPEWFAYALDNPHYRGLTSDEVFDGTVVDLKGRKHTYARHAGKVPA